MRGPGGIDSSCLYSRYQDEFQDSGCSGFVGVIRYKYRHSLGKGSSAPDDFDFDHH